MDLLPSPEQEEIVASVAAFIDAELPAIRLRQFFAERSTVDRAIWTKSAALGWFALGLSEALGGVGYGMAEEALMFREIGRRLAPGPLVATCLAARLAAEAGQVELAASIRDGVAVVGLAQTAGGVSSPAAVSGPVDLYDCVDTDLVLVASRAGAALFDSGALSAVEPYPCLDPGVRTARARIDDVQPVAVAAGGAIFRRGAVLTAAMAAGIAEAARDMAAEHAKTRIQFGKPIGVHQAVKHACTDMAVRAEAAASQVFFAAMTVGEGSADAAFQAASAKVVAIDAALRNARANIQVHGGMGFTWEHDAHLLLKRAHVLNLMFGARESHLAELIGLPAAQ